MQNWSQSLRFIFIHLKDFKLWIYGLVFVSSCIAISLTFKPYFVKLIINNISSMERFGKIEVLYQLVYMYITISLLMVIIQRMYDYLWMNLNCGLKKQIGLALLKLQMDKGKLFFEDKFPGSLASKIKDVMSGVPDLINISINKFYGYFLSVSVATIVLWHTNPKYSLGLIVWITLYFGVSLFFSSKGLTYCMNAAENRSKAMGVIVDVVTNISTVRLFNGQKVEYQNFSYHLDNYVKTDRQRDWFFLSLFSYQGFSFLIYQGMCLFWLISDLNNNLITNGDFVLVLLINTSIVNSMLSLSWDLNRFSTIIGDVMQALDIFLIEPEIRNIQNASPISSENSTNKSPKISLKNVSFFYDHKVPLFQNLSLEILSQQKIGIVGYSGSGKSTFINLLLREFDVKNGEILFDGRDIRSITLESLRENIGIVPQEPVLFHRSLKENIRYGKNNATNDKVIESSKKANIHEFISKLPMIYDSIAGDRGIKLSGGQRQRIGIARAILKDAPIFILDEATSQIDSVTESYIQTELFNIMDGKTTIVVAHRLSTLLHMDRILVFSDGCIVGDGSHEELLAANYHYKALWDAQIGGFLPIIPSKFSKTF